MSLLRDEVKDFALAMEVILQANDHKMGWSSEACSVEFLEDKLVTEIGEYFRDKDEIELIDVANFAMMIWCRKRGITK